MAKKSLSNYQRLDPKVVNGLKMATFGGVCFLDFFDLGTGSAISDTPKTPILRQFYVLGVSEMALPVPK